MKNIFFFLLAFILTISSNYALEEGLSVVKLKSGQKVVVKEVRDNQIVKIDTWINTGSINEDDKTSGISHFLEHLFFKGTTNYKTGEIDKILDSKGAEVNAATSKDYTHYYIEIPSKDFDLALKLHADMLQNPLIPRKELERERKVVIEEISKCKDSAQNRMFDNFYTLLYEKSNHPYKRTVIGKKEVIETVTREEILNYFNRFYTPDAYTTVIVGDIDKEEAIRKVSEAFNQTKRKQEKIKYPNILPITKIERKVDSMDIAKTHLMLGFLAPKFSKPIDNYPLDVLATMLSSGKSSILNQKLKEEKNLVLSISSGNYSQKDSGLFYVYATLNPKLEAEVESAIIEELGNIQQGKFDNNSLNRAKNLIKTDTYYSRESISNISDDLGYDFTFIDDINYYDNYLKNIDKVTKEDIIRVANKYFDLKKYAISIVRPSSFKEVSFEKNANEKTYNNKLIEKRDNTTKTLLENGATLITKKKKTNSIVAIDISFKGSKALEKKPTTSLLAALCATKGTKNYTSAALSEFLDENGIKLGVSRSNDIFSIVIQTTKDNLDKAFIALDEVINRPLFSLDELEKTKKRQIEELKGVSDNPSSYVFDEFRRLAFLNTIYGQNSTFMLNHINNVTRDDVIEYYSRIINPKNASIAVVGDIDEDYIAKKLNDIIKDNKEQKFSFKNSNYTPYHPQKNIESTLYKKELQAHWLALGYKTCGITNRKDIAVLNVINSILGQGMSSRLFVKLREEKSLAYTVGSSLISNILDGAFVTYIGTNKDSIEEAKQGLLSAIDTIKKEMVTTTELNDAKDKILGQFLLSLETNMDEANLLNWYSVLNLDLGAYEEYKKMIQEVNQNDIIETANKYFTKPYIYTVVVEK